MQVLSTAQIAGLTIQSDAPKSTLEMRVLRPRCVEFYCGWNRACDDPAVLLGKRSVPIRIRFLYAMMARTGERAESMGD